ncbi:MAG: copper chaperone PCu(A)C [Gammaproteobacteria bacterium]|nr:copper chaperone PCu(A)C [Gammaproteobacteria bacterium]
MKYLALIWLLLSQAVLADAAQNVVIDKPFARAAMQQQKNSAAFMQIINQGQPAAIVNARSSVSEIVELHTHINDNGVMRMRKIPQIDLPHGQMVKLKPGGLHVMFIKLKRDLNVGDMIDVTLVFDDGSEKALELPVHKVMMKHKGMSGHGKKMMHH